MNSYNIINCSKGRTQTAHGSPLVGAMVTAVLLLSGLSLISISYQPAIAQQQDMTTGGGGVAAHRQTVVLKVEPQAAPHHRMEMLLLQRNQQEKMTHYHR